ncbi:MAG: hypothetical protein H7839_14920 [Magnetococcus sp. YQC-5]
MVNDTTEGGTLDSVGSVVGSKPGLVQVVKIHGVLVVQFTANRDNKPSESATKQNDNALN